MGPPHLVTVDPRGGILDFGAHALPDGSLFLHASTTQLVPKPDESQGSHWTAQRGLPFWVRSRDDGRNWSEPERFPPLPDALWGHPATHSGVCRSGLALHPDGRLLLPSKATERPDGSFPYFGMIRVSRDLGETWEYGGRIAQDPTTHFSEPAIHITPNGRILVLYRCHPNILGSPTEVFLAFGLLGGRRGDLDPLEAYLDERQSGPHAGAAGRPDRGYGGHPLGGAAGLHCQGPRP